jgi:hypothetical protein
VFTSFVFDKNLQSGKRRNKKKNEMGTQHRIPQCRKWVKSTGLKVMSWKINYIKSPMSLELVKFDHITEFKGELIKLFAHRYSITLQLLNFDAVSKYLWLFWIRSKHHFHSNEWWLIIMMDIAWSPKTITKAKEL